MRHAATFVISIGLVIALTGCPGPLPSPATVPLIPNTSDSKGITITIQETSGSEMPFTPPPIVPGQPTPPPTTGRQLTGAGLCVMATQNANNSVTYTNVSCMQGNQVQQPSASTPAISPIVAQVPANAMLTFLVSTGDGVAGVSRIELDMVRQTCLVNKGGGVTTTDNGNITAGISPLSQSPNLDQGGQVPTAYAILFPAPPNTVPPYSLVPYSVAQDFATAIPGATTPYEVDYLFTARAVNGLWPYPGFSTAGIILYATADNQPTNNHCVGDTFAW